jgi:hypothetical protein
MRLLAQALRQKRADGVRPRGDAFPEPEKPTTDPRKERG